MSLGVMSEWNFYQSFTIFGNFLSDKYLLNSLLEIRHRDKQFLSHWVSFLGQKCKKGHVSHPRASRQWTPLSNFLDWKRTIQATNLYLYLYWEQSFKFSTFQPSWLWAWEISLLSFIPTSLCSLEHSRFLPRYWFPKGPVLWKILLTPRVTQHYSVETGQKQRYRQRLVSNWRSLYV